MSENTTVDERTAAIVAGLAKRHEGCEIRYTYCENPGCFEACLLKCSVRDGKVLSIDVGDTINQNNPREDLGVEAIKQGMLQHRPCVRGRMMAKTSDQSERLLHPMVNVGERGNPVWKRISWDDAIETIAQNIEKCVAEHGPYSILSSVAPSGVGRYYGYGFALSGMASLSGMNIPEHATYGGDALNPFAARATEAPDFLNAKVIIGVGWNVSSTFFQWGHVLSQVREAGTPIIIIDPRYSPTVQALADQWIPIRPGTEQALLMAMANVIFKEGLTDDAFLEKFVEQKGVAFYRDHVLGNDGTGDKTPEWAESICAVPAETIRELARLVGTHHGYSDHNPCFFKVHWPVSRVHEGENVSRAAQYVNILTGNVGVPGTTSNGADLVISSYAPHPMLFKETMQNIKCSGQALMNTHGIADAILYRDAVQSGEMDETEYRRRIGSAAEWPLPNIHMSFNEWGTEWNGTNETQRLVEAFKKLDFVAVMHQNITRPECRYADIVLPLADEHLEDYDDDYGMGGFICPTEMSVGTFSNFWVMKSAVIMPPGEAKPKSWILSKLAARLGVIQDYNPRFADVVGAPLEQWFERFEELHREAYEMWRPMFAQWCEANGFDYETEDYDEFKKHPIFRVPLLREAHYPLKEFITDGQPFDTPSGKIEMYSDFLATPGMGDHSAVYPSGYEPYNCYGGSYEPAIQPTSIYHVAYDSPVSPLAEEYPLRMLTPHSVFRNHSAFYNNAWVSEEARHSLWMSPIDAAREGVADGDRVLVANKKGQSYMDAYVTERVAPGTVINFHGAWFNPGDEVTEVSPNGIDTAGSANALTDNDRYPWPIQATHCASLVRVEKA